MWSFKLDPIDIKILLDKKYTWRLNDNYFTSSLIILAPHTSKLESHLHYKVFFFLFLWTMFVFVYNKRFLNNLMRILQLFSHNNEAALKSSTLHCHLNSRNLISSKKSLCGFVFVFFLCSLYSEMFLTIVLTMPMNYPL